MGWESLLRDLESEFDAAAAAELAAEVADRTRREVARLRLVDRLRPAIGQQVAVSVPAVGTLHGRLADLGADWLLLTGPGDRESIVPLAAVLTLGGIGALSAEPGSEGRVAARLDLPFALRGLARRRSAVTLVMTDGSSVVGTVDRVGEDFVELAEHLADEPRRASAVRSVRTVPIRSVVLVRAT